MSQTPVVELLRVMGFSETRNIHDGAEPSSWTRRPSRRQGVGSGRRRRTWTTRGWDLTPVHSTSNPLVHGHHEQPVGSHPSLRCVPPTGSGGLVVRRGAELTTERLKDSLPRGAVIDVLESATLDVLDENRRPTGRT